MNILTIRGHMKRQEMPFHGWNTTGRVQTKGFKSSR
jgi:hypothetical protein